ncbi:MAG: hypothetical protein QME50_06720 [Candidatus Bathyarchaeota archaeon]|nr:hypothetical protein [Candidatus Bathyarchaeota archaeon]
MQTIIRLLKKFRQAKRGVSNVIVVMLSLILIVLIVSNVVLWSYQMSQFDLERMQENIKIANVTRVTRSPWFTTKTEYLIERGSNISGTYMDTWATDDVNETFREEAYYDYSVEAYYNPSGYNLLNSTLFVSGSLSDLQFNDNSYMIFRSYPSAFSNSTATFGNTATGTARRNTENTIVGSIFTLTENGEAQSITAYIGMTVSSKKMKCAIYRYSDLSLIAQTEEKAPAVATTWVTFNFINKPILTANTQYLLVAWSSSGGGYAYLYYTTGTTNKGCYRFQPYGTNFPDPLPSPRYEARSYCIYCTYKPVIEETVEVEFTGTSNTENWTKIVWTIDSCFTTTDVTATFQLYNYNSSQYPTSGDGYMTDTIGTTDVTKTQNITTNPTYFRDASGNWKLKITGVKATNAPFDLKVDFVEFKTEIPYAYALSIIGEFTLDISAYPLAYIDSLEIQVRLRANDTLENWLLNAYNWTSGQYSVIGQVTLTTTDFEYYTVNLTDAWQSYVNDNGTIKIKFCDADPDANPTTINIDFFGVRAVIEGAYFNFKNNGSTTVHIVSIWIINVANHQRYNANLFINVGEEANYIRADISLPEKFIAKVVTERGNIAVFTE